MNIALFYNNLSHQEFEEIQSIFSSQYVKYPHYSGTLTVHLLQNPSLQQAFLSLFEIAQKQDAKFAVLLHRSAWIVDLEKFFALLNTEQIQQHALSVRVGKIEGKGFTFSPKLPYIDEDFMLINIERCKKLGIIDHVRNKKIKSHFLSWGGIHAELISFLENFVPYNELFIYSDGSDCQNKYGEFRGFSDPAFIYSQQFGLLSGTSRLLRKLYFQEISEVKFLQDSFFRKVVQNFFAFIKVCLGRINYEIKKKYDNA